MCLSVKTLGNIYFDILFSLMGQREVRRVLGKQVGDGNGQTMAQLSHNLIVFVRSLDS